jgi:hypothetical protein
MKVLRAVRHLFEQPIPVGKVPGVLGEELDVPAVDARVHAVAVELDFVQPTPTALLRRGASAAA